MFSAITRTVTHWREALRDAGGRWGSTPDEEAASYPCDDLLPGAEQWLFRAIDVNAPAATTFRWVCQLRVAPYSYDWLDNWGRRSPRTLTPGLEDVRPGQTAMTMFEIVHVELGESITVRSTRPTFGDVVATYCVVPVGTDRSRIVAKLAAVPPGGLRGALLRDVLPLGDLVMMRKQLKTLAELAAREAGSGHGLPARPRGFSSR